MRLFTPLLIALSLAAAPLTAQLNFGKVEMRTGFGKAKEGQKGRLVFDAERLQFIDESWNELFVLPATSIKKLAYSPSEGGGGSPLAKPFEMLQGKKHFLTVEFELDKLAGAVEFKLNKSNYEGVLQNAELLTGLEVERPAPEPTSYAEAQAVKAPPEQPQDGLLRITSDPEGAEIEIDRTFNGLSPRAKVVKPGEYQVTVRKPGYEPWQRTVAVDPGQSLEVHAELRVQP